GRAGKRGSQLHTVCGPLDTGEFPGRPIPGDFVQLHPDQVVVSRVQAANDFLEYLESKLLPVPVNAGPMGEHQCRFAARDDIDHAAGLEVLGNELVRAARRRVVPPAGPVASAADDAHDATRVSPVEAAGVLNTGRDTLSAFTVEVPEVVRNLRAEDIANGLERRLGQLRQRLVAESAWRGDAFTREADVLENAQGVSQVIGEFVGAPAGGPFPVLHELERMVGV